MCREAQLNSPHSPLSYSIVADGILVSYDVGCMIHKLLLMLIQIYRVFVLSTNHLPVRFEKILPLPTGGRCYCSPPDIARAALTKKWCPPTFVDLVSAPPLRHTKHYHQQRHQRVVHCLDLNNRGSFAPSSSSSAAASSNRMKWTHAFFSSPPPPLPCVLFRLRPPPTFLPCRSADRSTKTSPTS